MKKFRSKQIAARFALLIAILLVSLACDHQDESSSAPANGVRPPYTPPVDVIPTSSEWSKPVNIGHPVNSSGWEDSVSISPDDKTLYFSYANYDFLTFLASHGEKRKITGKTLGMNSQDMGDILVSFNQGNHWSTPRLVENVSLPFALDDGAFTQHGRLLFHSGLRNGNVGGPGSSDIYVSKGSGRQWSKPINLGPPVCTKASESNPWISPDGNLLLFDSDRPGGKGSRDIWMARKVDNRWQQPVTLGSPVNTAAEEVQPFLTQDGETLFFAGDARNKEVDHVIYRCRRKPAGGWTEPEVIISNLVGEPTLTANGRKLYFVHIYRMPDKTYNSDIMFTERRD